MPGSELLSTIRTVIEWAALAIEMLGALVIVAGVLRVAVTRGTIRFLFRLDKLDAYESYKHQMGMSLLLGLEFLVAGDVVRTVALEQDPTFAFRIMVDIASKGLSPGINDPTTAVLALDQIHPCTVAASVRF
jgi:uncharacterized membrane protein